MLPLFKLKGFTIRPFRYSDAASLQKNISDREIYRYTLRIPYPYTIKHARQWIEHCSKGRKELNLAIAKGAEVIGGIGLRDFKKNSAEVGYWLARKYWNRGIMTMAIKRMTSYGFAKLKLRRITAKVFTANKASIRVLEKAGYKLGKKLLPRKKANRILSASMYVKKRIS